jgi:hypothetical protein
VTGLKHKKKTKEETDDKERNINYSNKSWSQACLARRKGRALAKEKAVPFQMQRLCLF